MKLRFFAASIFFISSFQTTWAQEVVTLEQAVTMALERNFDVMAARDGGEAAEGR